MWSLCFLFTDPSTNNLWAHIKGAASYHFLCKKFHHYLFYTVVQVHTDFKPLIKFIASHLRRPNQVCRKCLYKVKGICLHSHIFFERTSQQSIDKFTGFMSFGNTTFISQFFSVMFQFWDNQNWTQSAILKSMIEIDWCWAILCLICSRDITVT